MEDKKPLQDWLKEMRKKGFIKNWIKLNDSTYTIEFNTYPLK